MGDTPAGRGGREGRGRALGRRALGPVQPRASWPGADAFVDSMDELADVLAPRARWLDSAPWHDLLRPRRPRARVPRPSRSSPTARAPRSRPTAHAALSYGPAFGYPPLRAWIAERHGVAPERVLVTNGSLQGFVFLAQHLLADGPRACSSRRRPTTGR